MKNRMVWILLPLVLFLLLVFMPQFISLYVDWIWFKSILYENLFTVKINAQIISAAAGLVAGFIITFLSLWASIRATQGRVITTSFYGQEIPRLNIVRHFDKIRIIVPIVVGIFVAMLFSTNWMTLLSYLHAVDFGYQDPIFSKDSSFYLFTIPFYEIIVHTALFILVISFVAAALTYLLKGAVVLSPKGLSTERAVTVHLSVIGGLIFLLLSLKTYISMHALLYSSDGLLAGAKYTDVYAVIPLTKVQIALAIITAVLLITYPFLKQKFMVIAGIALYFAVALIGSSLYPAILQKFVVAPNELVKETPYIKHNIAATRKGFGIEAVDERNISGGTTLTKKDIKNNRATVKNIRLWDHRPLLDTFSQVQEIRTYYEFTTVGNDRYLIDGEYRQTMLSPRELSSESIPTRNWINETLTFTHGYGVTLGPVNQVTPEGLPVLIVKDIPPVSTKERIRIERPEIYYGKLTNNYVIVNTKSKEFDYPSGEENVFTAYSGKSGVTIDSFFKKLVFAAHFSSLKLFLSNDITRESSILFNRNISQRLKKAMPFLYLDSDPYMVISEDGHLFWIYDAYTISKRFPYSQPLKGGGINYIRNSVKVTINAFDGSMHFYIANEDDAIIQTISRIFPGTFKPISDMPPDLRQHIRYPLDIFGVQTSVYSTYHMEDPQIFYNREDQWEIPVMGAGMQKERMEAYYTIMKLPEEQQEEFILMLPFNPQKKDNLSAWMVARSDGEYYGKLVVYRFPKDRLVFGPKQIVARINQDTEISRQISLWDQRGSQVIQGTLLVIPIENSLIYVQPLYLRAETGKIPELKRVIVTYENRIAMEKTLEEALSRIFGDVGMAERVAAPDKRAIPTAADEKSLIQQAQEHYRRAMQAQREGNWGLYGDEIQKLGDVIRQLQK